MLICSAAGLFHFSVTYCVTLIRNIHTRQACIITYNTHYN